jgi:hypothetical protein
MVAIPTHIVVPSSASKSPVRVAEVVGHSESQCRECGATDGVVELRLSPPNASPNRVIAHHGCSAYWFFKQPNLFEAN